jgi:hypothetical protein
MLGRLAEERLELLDAMIDQVDGVEASSRAARRWSSEHAVAIDGVRPGTGRAATSQRVVVRAVCVV